MRVLIVGSLAGELGRAARIAIARGAKLDQADNADAALAGVIAFDDEGSGKLSIFGNCDRNRQGRFIRTHNPA